MAIFIKILGQSQRLRDTNAAYKCRSCLGYSNLITPYNSGIIRSTLADDWPDRNLTVLPCGVYIAVSYTHLTLPTICSV